MSLSSPGQRQMPLPMQLRDDATFENFLATQGQEPLLGALREQLSPAGESIIYIYGPAACGRTHLLQAACHLAGEGALYLPLAELANHTPQEVLAGIERLRLVCLDDLHRVVGNEPWDQALFNLINEARAADCRLLLAADAAPRALPVDLPDLRSRLGWGIVYQMQEPGDGQKADILRFRAERRGLQLAPEVASYIVSRASRSLNDLLQVLDRLDRASLVQQRALSVPFVKNVLGW